MDQLKPLSLKNIDFLVAFAANKLQMAGQGRVSQLYLFELLRISGLALIEFQLGRAVEFLALFLRCIFDFICENFLILLQQLLLLLKVNFKRLLFILTLFLGNNRLLLFLRCVQRRCLRLLWHASFWLWCIC